MANRLNQQRQQQLFSSDSQAIKDLGRSAASALMVHHHLQQHPVSNLTQLASRCHMAIPTVTKSINRLRALGIVEEITGKERGRIYCYHRYLTILDKGVGEYTGQ